MVPPREDKIPDQPLVAVHDKVPTKLGGLFMSRDEGGGGEPAEVAPVGLG